MSNRRQSVGRWGEQAAAEFLAAQGFEIQARNVRTPYGEIDLIARKGELTLFVEVKARTNEAFGLPEDSIGARKLEHLRSAVEHYMQEHPSHGAWQVDAIAVEGHPGGDARITRFEDILG